MISIKRTISAFIVKLMRMRQIFIVLAVVLISRIGASAQTFDLPELLKEAQAVARKTAYQGYVEYTSDFNLTEEAANGKKIRSSYESICSRKNCVSIPVGRNDKRFSEKKIADLRRQAAKIFVKSENLPDHHAYTDQENANGYGISIYNNWFNPSLYLKFCRSELADQSIVNQRPTLKIRVADCNPATVAEPKLKSALEFMAQTEGFVWIDAQDKAIVKMEIYPEKEFPNLSKTNEPLIVIETGKVADKYWFWKNVKVRALDNKTIFPAYKTNVEYEFYNFRLPAVEVESIQNK